ncbi:hypothetical protein IV203_030519 [Nitzschia inconspicua]|uniref:Uncharacterized protein n=1 Tax=Nitzschia inconspicua TaxID=303405 RepID=A0A9K3LVF0_9STRA|nr:hypothetical protein IV203_030519 [Nitzschia inconspicua]
MDSLETYKWSFDQKVGKPRDWEQITNIRRPKSAVQEETSIRAQHKRSKQNTANNHITTTLATNRNILTFDPEVDRITLFSSCARFYTHQLPRLLACTASTLRVHRWRQLHRCVRIWCRQIQHFIQRYSD